MKTWLPALQLSQAARSPAWPGTTWRETASVGRIRALAGAAGLPSGRACGPPRQRRRPPTPTCRCGMEQLRVPRLLAGALAAVTGAVVASFFGVEGTLIGAALGSILVTPAEAVYTRTLASADTLARRSLLRRVGEEAGPSEEGASKAHPEPTGRPRRQAGRRRRRPPRRRGLHRRRSPFPQPPRRSLFLQRPRRRGRSLTRRPQPSRPGELGELSAVSPPKHLQ